MSDSDDDAPGSRPTSSSTNPSPIQGIQIYLRLKPSKQPSGYLTQEAAKLKFAIPRSEELINNTRTDYRYSFNGILDMNAKQEEVYDQVGAQAVTNAVKGFNSTIFAYGQTGSGKTFTITGGSERYVDRGIIPRAISHLFESFKKDTDCQYSAFISYMEIYNEAGYDLLDSEHEITDLKNTKKVTMMEDEDGNYHLNNLSMHPVASEEVSGGLQHASARAVAPPFVHEVMCLTHTRLWPCRTRSTACFWGTLIEQSARRI